MIVLKVAAIKFEAGICCRKQDIEMLLKSARRAWPVFTFVLSKQTVCQTAGGQHTKHEEEDKNIYLLD